MRIESSQDARARERRRAHAHEPISPRGRKCGAASQSEGCRARCGWASGRHGALRESQDPRGSAAAVALGGSLDPRAAERRADHHGRELERVAGRGVDDRIVSAGRWSRGPLGGPGS